MFVASTQPSNRLFYFFSVELRLNSDFDFDFEGSDTVALGNTLTLLACVRHMVFYALTCSIGPIGDCLTTTSWVFDTYACRWSMSSEKCPMRNREFRDLWSKALSEMLATAPGGRGIHSSSAFFTSIANARRSCSIKILSALTRTLTHFHISTCIPT